MYAAPTEETVRLVAEKGTQKGSADSGRRSSRRTTGKVICTPIWRTVKNSAAGCILLFSVESGRRIEKIGEQFNYLDGNEWDHMHLKSGTGDHQPR